MISEVLHSSLMSLFQIKVFVLFLFFILQESETISVDDVSDIFKMYGVDYKEVREGFKKRGEVWSFAIPNPVTRVSDF